MKNDSTRATRPVRVAFLNCSDATVFAAELGLSREEEERVATLLGWLQDAGALLLPKQATPLADTFDGLVAHLRGTVGATLVEAGLTAGAPRAPSSGGAPVAVMPIWPFEPEGEDPADPDVLLSSGRLWGADVLIEALRVGGPDNPVPVVTVRSRFDRWARAGGGGRLRAAVQPPGRTDWYVLGAISAPG